MKLKLLFLLAISLLLFACGSSKHVAVDSEMMVSEAVALSAPVGNKAMMMRGGGLESVDFAMAMDAGGYMPMRSQRMVNYTGSIDLESSAPEAVIDTVAQKAVAKGGSVNNRRNGFISLQIPVAQFKEFFEYILTLGRVINKNLYASDITDAYADNAARLRIQESALARLQELLKAAKTEQEKLALLKEIQRVSEQIEQSKLEEKDLLRKAAFSTINLSVRNEPQKIMPYGTNIAAFQWFHFVTSKYRNTDPIKLKVPQDFIETEDTRKTWSAASALNSEIFAFKRENNPRGTPQFWLNAMQAHFKATFNAEIKEDMLRLQSVGPDPMVYYIAILKSSNKKTLKIAVARFPTLEAEQKNSNAIKTVLKEAK